jgi:hypothetical protein
VNVDRPRAGAYRVRATVRGCREGSCAFGVQAYGR